MSFYNENPKGPIDPTPMVGMVGLIEDADKRVTQSFKKEGDVIVLLGENTGDLSASEYLYVIHKLKKGNLQIDIEREKAVQEACREAIESGIVNSAHDASEGGLAITLAESCITDKSKMIGAAIKLDAADNIRKDAMLFGEAPSRIVVSLARDKLSFLEKIAKKHNIPYEILGTTGGKNFSVQYGEAAKIDLPLAALSDAWRNAIPRRLQK
ncbi:unnamed protein product [marine sediment metagenome]|uniref:PurM-like C-terminal domain-containing protein n=1 Tax=marine sediment metagenome TaxID=412755 RepID=X0S1N9_9ZZZZ